MSAIPSPSPEPIPRDLSRDLAGLSVPQLSDALDALGVEGALQGLGAWSGSAPGRLVSGAAFPVQFEAVPVGTPAPAADYLDEAPPGSIVVLANGGRMDCTVWGGLLTFRAGQLDVRGTVIDGCFRDVEEIRASGYPIFARGAFMRSGKGRARMVGLGIPVSIGGIAIHPGDILCGDDNGVLAVPTALFPAVVAAAREIQEREEKVLADLRVGSRLDAARRRHGYNRGAAGAAGLAKPSAQ
jgi:4-hydroxy-4-methyl-2-oxoglutarate aldolase